MRDDPGIMSLGIVALAAFLLVGSLATILGRNAGVDPTPMPFRGEDSTAIAGTDTTGSVEPLGELPAEITESSGIARSGQNPEVWWTHNDGPDGRAFALRSDGTLVGTWQLQEGVVDVEDIASGPCPGDGGTHCLYLADAGDNQRNRQSYAVHVVREPDLTSGSGGALQSVATLRFRYPGASLDSEALALLPDGGLIVITKGQDGGAEMYALPAPASGTDGEVIVAESLGMLPLDVADKERRVTGAAVSPSGSRLAVRSDVDVTLFELPGHRMLKRCAFGGPGQQGEAVDFVDETTLMLTFEAAETGRAPIVRASCAP